jgi:hypothetical protein
MSELGIAELLRQGNAIILAALINRLLLPHAMTATLEKCDRHLNVSISSGQRLPQLDFCVPESQGLVALMRRLLRRLDVQAIDSVSLSWQTSDAVQDVAAPDRKLDRSQYAWNAEFKLASPETATSTVDASTNAISSTIQPAIQSTNQGDKPVNGDLSAETVNTENNLELVAELPSDRPNKTYETSNLLPAQHEEPDLAAGVSYVIEPAPEHSRLAKCDRDLPAPIDNIGQQLVQYAIATLVMACLFLGIHFAINNSKPAKNNSSSALTHGIAL